MQVLCNVRGFHQVALLQDWLLVDTSYNSIFGYLHCIYHKVMIGSLQVVKLSMIITTISPLQFPLAPPSLIELLIVNVIICCPFLCFILAVN